MARAADFAPAINYPGSLYPISVALADLDGNGTLDAVTGDIGSNTGRVSVLAGHGDGSFGAATAYPYGDRANAVAASDLDGDGIVDVAVTALDPDAVSVLRGSGGGRLAAPVQWPVGPNPSDVDVADLNGDGVPDLVSTDNGGDGTVTVLRGLGGGRYAAGVSYPVGNTYPARSAIADIDGDGRLDVAVALREDQVAVLWGTGGGALSAPSVVRIPGMLGNWPRGIAIGDLNRDGRPDIVTAGGATVAVLYGGGRALASRSFAAYPVAGENANAFGVAVADFDGDGNLDVAVANNGTSDARGNVSVLHGDGAGGLGPAEGYDIPATYPSPTTDEFGAGANELAAADVTGDGRPDLVVSHMIESSDSGGIAVLRNSGTWSPAAAAPPPGSTPVPAAGGSVKVRLRIGRVVVHGRRVRVRVSHARAAHGRTTVSVRRKGSARWVRLKRSRRAAFTVRFRKRPGRYVTRARFTGREAGAPAKAAAHRRFRVR